MTAWVVNVVQRVAPTEFSAVFASLEEAQAFIQESHRGGTWERDGWLRVQALQANTAAAVVAYLARARASTTPVDVVTHVEGLEGRREVASEYGEPS